MFEIAHRQLGVTRLVMLGDQLATDIAGAQAAGIDVRCWSVAGWRPGLQGQPPAFVRPGSCRRLRSRPIGSDANARLNEYAGADLPVLQTPQPLA